MSNQIGFEAEDCARQYLIDQGLYYVDRNVFCRVGEIDLVMRHDDYIVFVEVRSRRSSFYGGALASITRAKQRKIIQSAAFYLAKQGYHDRHPCRFDVVSLDGQPPVIQWIKNAFDLNG